MRKVFEDSNLKQGTDTSQVIRLLGSKKPYLCFNTHFQICDCNELFVTLFNINRNEFLGADLTERVQNKQFIEAIRKAQSEGFSTYHGKVLFETGLSEVYLEAVLINIKLKNQEGKGTACYILESKFPESENKFVTGIISSESMIPGGLYASVSVHDANGGVVYISPSIETLLGYSSSELKDTDPLLLVYPEDKPVIIEVIEKLNSGNNFLNSRYRMVHKDGMVKYVETASYLIKDGTGAANHIVNVTWDLGSQQGISQALQISEQKYYRLVMNLPVGVSLISKNGQLLEVNDSLKKMMRLPADYLIPEVNILNIKAMKRNGISAQFSKCIKTKKMINGEIQFKISLEEPEIYLTYSFVPILDHFGNIESVIGYVNDLTKQKKAESDYHERADFLNLVINAIKTPFFVKNQDHKWVVLNDAAVEMMGQAREALIGKSDYDLFPKEQADIFWKFDELVFKSGSNINEEQITWSDGTIHTIVTYKELYVEKPSGKKFIVGTIHDITSYKKIEEELRASELKYRELFDNANDFILTTDFEGKITNANRTLLRYLQTDIESLMKHNVFEFIREENIDFANDIKAKMLAGEPDHSFEIKAYGIHRQLVIYEVKASLIKQNSEPVGVQCVFSDVTDRKEASLRLEKLNESLLELNANKDKFFKIIAHDLRNPYSSIIGFSEMLLEDIEQISKDEIRDSLKIIHSAAKNSFSLLENLLAWSRLETGSMPFSPVKLVLSDAIEEVVNVLFSLAYRKQIEIDNLVKPDITVLADKNMLNTILNNLVMNAIKFTQVGGEIKIYAKDYISEPDKDFIMISVADTGIGMDAETCKTLFKLNKMVSRPGTEKEQGTGLGLVLVREMVEKHGGKIIVESTPGKGSDFSFLIPVYKPEADS